MVCSRLVFAFVLFVVVCGAQQHAFVTVHKSNSHLVESWKCWASRNNVANVVFVPLDAESAAKLKELEITDIAPSRFTNVLHYDKAYQQALAAMKQGAQEVVIASADTLFLANPFKVIDRSCAQTISSKVDFLHVKHSEESLLYLEELVKCVSEGSLPRQCKALAVQQRQDTCILDDRLQSDFLNVFVKQTPQKQGVYPMVIDLSGVDSTQALTTLKDWSVLLNGDECKPPARDECPAKDTPFRLTVRILTFDRVDSLRRAVSSLRKANYDGDTVDLEVFVDFPKDGSTPEHEKVVKYVTYGLQWPHGNVTKKINTEPGGIIKQWITKLDAAHDGHVFMLFEDDMEVSPRYYVWAKAAISFYYLDCNNYHPSFLGLSIERQHETLGHGKLFWLPEKNPDWVTQAHNSSGAVYATQKDSSWAPIVFPRNWNAFVSWFWSKGVNENPCLYGLISNKWHFDTPGRIWTPWLHKFVFENGLFTLYFNYGIYEHEWVPNALLRNHRETGLHFNATKAKALHRWQPFIEADPSVEDYHHPSEMVYTDFFQNKIYDIDSLQERRRLQPKVENPCQYFDFEGVTL